MIKWSIKYLTVVFLILPIFCFGLSFTVKPTAETCSGNGSLTFVATDTDPNGSIVYIVYKLPNISTPYAVVDANSLSGLSSGNYKVIAKETVGNNSTSKEVDVTIESEIVELIYSVKSLNQACSSTSNISVIVISGQAVSYEIFSGPVIFPPQESNTFKNLPVGVYKIRVFDHCGIGVVQTFTVTKNAAGLTISEPKYSNITPPSCDFAIATNIITASSGTVIGYPLNISYTVFPPNNGATISTQQIINSGNLTSQEVSETIPQYIGKIYSYQISITDACGKTYSKTFDVDNDIKLDAAIINLDCNQNSFDLIPTNFTPPYTLNFISFPDTFNPNLFNENYPGPFNQNEVFFGDLNNPTPKGDYVVSINDACGRKTTTGFTIKDFPPMPNASAKNDGCLTSTGTITIKLLPNYQIATAIIISAPPEYNFPLPKDISSEINTNGVVVLKSVPIGEYKFLLTDNCGDAIEPIPVKIPVFENQGLDFEVKQGCELETASLKIINNNKNKLKSVIITAAPIGFQNTLPFDASENITSNGIFYLNQLPEGNYTFNTIDECNFANTITVFIGGYKILNNSVTLNKNCGSFDISLDYETNSTKEGKFWLQKLLKNNQWGNPETGIEYVEGTIPSNIDSFPLKNKATNFNLTFNGTFRILHNFSTYNNGIDINNNAVSSENKDCLEIITTDLQFKEALEIVDAYKIPCAENGKLDVYIIAYGTIPLQYSIIAKDGVPFLFDNGTLNVFSDLGSGIYTFQVKDDCGGIKNRIFNVAALASLVTNNKACNLVQCVNTISGNETFDLTSQNISILGNQSPDEYTLNYYVSQSDAELSKNPIQNLQNFNPTSNPQTIYTKLFFNQLSNCYQTNSFEIIVGQIPKLNLKSETLSCNESPVFLNASVGNLQTTTYQWSSGIAEPNITISQIGITNLTITANNDYILCEDGFFSCTNSKNIIVNIPLSPEIKNIETADWTENENSIKIITSDDTAFEYSLDNINFQDSNVFNNLTPDLYTVYVRNKMGCETINKEIWLLNYPKFFTPNSDGYNENWFIKNSINEPDFEVYIYDRFGKLITHFNSSAPGWDGNYNGRPLKATDYWFVVYRQDGKIYKGHFSLVR